VAVFLLTPAEGIIPSVRHGAVGRTTMTDPTNYPAYIDRRDAEVVSRMEKGTTYPVGKIETAYKRYTDIRNDRTAEQRKNDLADSPCMEFTGTPGYFTFVGFDDAEDVLL